MLWVLIRSTSRGASNEYPQHMFFCGYSLEVPHQGASNEYPQHMFYRGTSNEFPQHMFLWRNKLKIIPELSSNTAP